MRNILFAVFTVLLSVTFSAAQVTKPDGKPADQELGDGVKDLGKGMKKAGKGIGKEGRRAGRNVKRESREIKQDAKKE